MKRAFSYIQFLTVLALFLIFFTLTAPSLFKMLRYVSQKTVQINSVRQITRALDVIQQDVLTAEKIDIKNNEIHYLDNDIDYIYLRQNNRLARKKTSYTYLTPTGIDITGFLCRLNADNSIELEIIADKKIYRRKMQCLN